MSMHIDAAAEYNEAGWLIYAVSVPGAYVRGKTQEQALAKFGEEIRSFSHWANGTVYPPEETFAVHVRQKKESSLQICDADSDILFDGERLPLTMPDYVKQKALVLQSARGFQKLYDSIPEKDRTCLSPRPTFYGEIPRTASEMYLHTNDVTNYYMGEIGIPLVNLPVIAENRLQAFALLEKTTAYLDNPVTVGSCEEEWSLRKVLRRFLWHDRIHAKAMWRMAVQIWGTDTVANPFFFSR